MKIVGRDAVAAAAALLGLAAAAGCGGGGGGTPKEVEQANLYMISFSLPNYSGVFLDEDLYFVLAAPVKIDSINPDSIQIRTGPTGGVAPFGTFVRGRPLVDEDGNRVVIIPDRTSASAILRAEKKGILTQLDGVRIDLGDNAPNTSQGSRLPLVNRAIRDVVSFLPDVPTRAALDDTGYAAASTYTVAVPAFPSTNTLENLSGDPLLAPDGRVFTSTFTTVPSLAPALFLGSESSGPPRVINSAPFNGESQVDVLSRIAIRFSQPLDPRTVIASEFRVEAINPNGSVVALPVSTFLGQQRLGAVEVTLTPLGPLPGDRTIRVIVGSGIEDLTGNALTTSTISFFTGATIIPPSGPVQEEFQDTSLMDAALTTANWANSKPYVGGVDDAVTAAFAPYAGNGADGAFAATTGVTTQLNTGTSVQRVYNFTSFTVPIGATVVATGNYPLVIHCQGDILVEGTVTANGADGGVGFSGTGTNPGVGLGGAGGAGGPGGTAGGNGAFFTVGGGGNFDGQDGFGFGKGLGGSTGENDSGYTAFWPRTAAGGSPQTCSATSATQPSSTHQCRHREAGGGGGFGFAGNNSDNAGFSALGRNGSLIPNGGFGGPSWGSATFSNASTNATVDVMKEDQSGTTTIQLTGIPTLVQQQGGSGGGGGGGEDDRDGSSQSGTAGNEDEGGGGGGGGGGAIQMVAYGTIEVSGILQCNGGDGGNSALDAIESDFGQGAGGGGGSGGAIWLQCRGVMTLGLGAGIEAFGGVGGSGYGDGTTVVYRGGTGGDGRIRLESGDGLILNSPAGSSTGTFQPALDVNSTAISQWQNTGMFTPKYQAFKAFDDPTLDNNCDDDGDGTPFEDGEACDPTADLEILPDASSGSIRIYLEATTEDFDTPVDDPDPLASTGWIKVYDSDTGGFIAGATDVLENNKYWRFRIDFDVDPLHSFTDPLPLVRMLRVGISAQ
jgi:hypothetical protein